MDSIATIANPAMQTDIARDIYSHGRDGAGIDKNAPPQQEFDAVINKLLIETLTRDFTKQLEAIGGSGANGLYTQFVVDALSDFMAEQFSVVTNAYEGKTL